MSRGKTPTKGRSPRPAGTPAKAAVAEAGAGAYRPFPWFLLPDWVWVVWGTLQVSALQARWPTSSTARFCPYQVAVISAPLLATQIASTEALGWLCKCPLPHRLCLAPPIRFEATPGRPLPLTCTPYTNPLSPTTARLFAVAPVRACIHGLWAPVEALSRRLGQAVLRDPRNWFGSSPFPPAAAGSLWAYCHHSSVGVTIQSTRGQPTLWHLRADHRVLPALDGPAHRFCPPAVCVGNEPTLKPWCTTSPHAPGPAYAIRFELSTVLVYNLLRNGPRFRLFARHHVLIHKEGHDRAGFFKPPYSLLNHLNINQSRHAAPHINACQYFCGLFYGQECLTTVSHSQSPNHLHPSHARWHNDADDVHTNLDLDRTSLWSFVQWTPRFSLYWSGVTPLLLFCVLRQWAFARRMALGMAAYYGIMVALWLWSPSFCFCYYIYPHLEVSFTLHPQSDPDAMTFLGSIAYLWHGFVSPGDPSNQYINSMTIVEGQDNVQPFAPVWNEDYHVVHHHFPGVHWSESPRFYQQSLSDYGSAQATIFRDTEQGMLHALSHADCVNTCTGYHGLRVKTLHAPYCMTTQKWDQMASKFVDLSGKMDHEAKRELLLARLRFIAGKGGLAGRESGADAWKSWGSGTVRNWDDAGLGKVGR
eukprot:gene900-395_t